MSVRALAPLALLFGAQGCVDVERVPVEPAAAPLAAEATLGAPVDFELAGLDGGTVTALALRGRLTLVVFAATYDTPSQAAVPIASALVRRHHPRLNGLVVVFEPEANRPLAQAFVSAMDVAMPVAMADVATLEGRGAFPGVRHVPSYVLLDREGREVWRRYGLASADVLEEAVRAREAR